jgi:hippurate hydrolase
MINQIRNIALKNFDEIIKVRRHLHQNPELSFEEHKTSQSIQDFLKYHDIPFTAGIVKTGIIAKIEGKNPYSKEIVLRADMDALPIEEKK